MPFIPSLFFSLFFFFLFPFASPAKEQHGHYKIFRYTGRIV